MINVTEDLKIRWKKVQQKMHDTGADACLIASNVNLYYMTGMIIIGYVYLPAEGEPLYFVRRPVGLTDNKAVYIRKPEDIPAILQEKGLSLPHHILLEADQLTYNEYLRLESVFQPAKTGNATEILRKARMIKTPWEISQFRISATKHTQAYSKVKECYSPGISDIEFQSNIEKVMRSLGSIGLFRAFGSNMDIYMGSILTGENAESPSPFDFALGGAGTHPSLPIGADGSILKKGTSVMVDMAGNYTAYITDMTRTFSMGKLPEIAYQAHQVSIDILNRIVGESHLGTSCARLYDLSLQISEEAGLSKYFMGTKQQAKFVGHGVGIEINELPVLTGRSKDVLEEGMVIAIEPKFVLPEIGAVGIENTYLMTSSGLEKLTQFEENIINLEG